MHVYMYVCMYVYVYVYMIGKTGHLTYKTLLDWEDMHEMLTKNQLKIDELEKLWAALPKATNPKGFEEEGIDLEAFLSLNEALEDSLYSVEVNEEGPVG